MTTGTSGELMLPFVIPGSELDHTLTARARAGLAPPRRALTVDEREAMHHRLDAVETLRRYRADSMYVRELGLQVGRGPFAASKALTAETRRLRCALYGETPARADAVLRVVRRARPLDLDDAVIAEGLRFVVADDAVADVWHRLGVTLRRLDRNAGQRQAIGVSLADLDRIADDAARDLGAVAAKRDEAHAIGHPAQRARLLADTCDTLDSLRARYDELARRADAYTIALADVTDTNQTGSTERM